MGKLVLEEVENPDHLDLRSSDINGTIFEEGEDMRLAPTEGTTESAGSSNKAWARKLSAVQEADDTPADEEEVCADAFIEEPQMCPIDSNSSVGTPRSLGMKAVTRALAKETVAWGDA